jgi:hypothetical protein
MREAHPKAFASTQDRQASVVADLKDSLLKMAAPMEAELLLSVLLVISFFQQGSQG